MLNIPDGTVFVLIQESPVVGHRQLGAVGDGDYFTGPRAVQHTAKVHCGGGEVEVGVVDLSVQLHHVLLWVSLVVYLEELGNKMKVMEVLERLELNLEE